MPIKSQAQRRFLHATNPKLAKEMESKTPKGKALPEKKKTARAGSVEVKRKEPGLGGALARALVGGGMVGGGVGLGTQKAHYQLNKEYYTSIADALRTAGSNAEKNIAAGLERNVPLAGGWLSRRVPQGELAKKIPTWGSLSDEVLAGSKRLGRASGIGAGLLTAATLLTLDRMRNAERKKYASPHKEYLDKVLGIRA